MPRLWTIDPSQATGETGELLAAVQQSLGVVPNMATALATSPAALNGWLELNRALHGGQLDSGLQERIAIGIAEANQCTYCLSAHTYVGKHVLKLSDQDIHETRHLSSSDAKIDAALTFARTVLDTRGGVSDADIEAVRAAGYSDGEIAEIVSHVALNVLTNYFNKVADVEIEFPLVEPHRHAAA